MKASDTRRAGSSEESSESGTPQRVARKFSASTDERAKSGYSPRCISIHRRCKRLRVRLGVTPKTVPFGLIRADYAQSWIPLSGNYHYENLAE
jgi:hypothetical protein